MNRFEHLIIMMAIQDEFLRKALHVDEYNGQNITPPSLPLVSTSKVLKSADFLKSDRGRSLMLSMRPESRLLSELNSSYRTISVVL